MKKMLYAILVVTLIFAFSCEEDSRPKDKSVDSIKADDLPNYVDNGNTPSDDGVQELMAAMTGADTLGDVLEDWAENDPDISVLLPGAPIGYGLSRTMTPPDETDINDMLEAFEMGGDFNVSASIDNEIIDLSDGDPSASGTFTVNAEAVLKGDIDDDGGDVDAEAEMEVTGTNIETVELDMPGFACNMETETSISASSSSVKVDTNSALVLAFSLSNIDGSSAPSGKYIYKITINEEVKVDMDEEPDVKVDASLSLKIYDNAGELRVSYEYDADDFLELSMTM